ncbi:MAG: tRNA (adenosine(37)-N6)-threonylcarbamoyltransferase complex ATPase subunit type 1 TsaE [Candidatus Cryptobacteroides sp.]|nr:tRNA (adenosine(37)-N6)-threonylcarbamoyltransferase complex ATPase subunit type 1 TsaE [Bacteroidales bacterium]
MRHEIIIAGLEDIDAAAGRFLQETENSRIIAFYAPMGAGKTTFTSAICRRLGVRDDAVSSPTFSIVNEYRTAEGESIFHFDFYRINKTEEAYDIGFFDYIDSGSLCLIEWPENIEEILPEETLKVRIQVNPLDNSRTVSWED